MDGIYSEAQIEIDAHNRRVADNNTDVSDESDDDDDSDDGNVEDDDRNHENVNGRAFLGRGRRPRVTYEDQRRMKRNVPSRKEKGG